MVPTPSPAKVATPPGQDGGRGTPRYLPPCQGTYLSSRSAWGEGIPQCTCPRQGTYPPTPANLPTPRDRTAYGVFDTLRSGGRTFLYTVNLVWTENSDWAFVELKRILTDKNHKLQCFCRLSRWVHIKDSWRTEPQVRCGERWRWLGVERHGQGILRQNHNAQRSRPLRWSTCTKL